MSKEIDFDQFDTDMETAALNRDLETLLKMRLNWWKYEKRMIAEVLESDEAAELLPVVNEISKTYVEKLDGLINRLGWVRVENAEGVENDPELDRTQS